VRNRSHKVDGAKGDAEMTDQENREKAYHYGMELEPGSFKVTGHDAELTHRAIRKAWEKRWPLVIYYGIVTLGGIVDSSLANGLLSVAISIVAAVVTTLIGMFMLWQVITITITIR
jgi:hypothetical protein